MSSIKVHTLTSTVSGACAMFIPHYGPNVIGQCDSPETNDVYFLHLNKFSTVGRNDDPTVLVSLTSQPSIQKGSIYLPDALFPYFRQKTYYEPQKRWYLLLLVAEYDSIRPSSISDHQVPPISKVR